MIDGGYFGLLMGAVDDEQPEKAGPSGLEEAVGFFKKPNFMFVPFVVGRAAQRGGRAGEEVAGVPGAVAENSEFFDVIGRTALKARN